MNMKRGFNTMLGKDSNLQRVICHLAHIFLKDGSRIHCDDFMNKTEPLHPFKRNTLLRDDGTGVGAQGLLQGVCTAEVET